MKVDGMLEEEEEGDEEEEKGCKVDEMEEDEVI